MAPIIRCGVSRIDAKTFDNIDHLEHLLDPCPTREPQQDVASRPHVGNGSARRTSRDRAQDIDTRHDGAEVVGGPADERKDVAGREGENTPSAIQYLLCCRSAETDPVLDMLFEPQELYVREVAHATSPTSFGGARMNCPRPGRRAFHSCGQVRSVRRIPKESGLEELGTCQPVGCQGESGEFGPR